MKTTAALAAVLLLAGCGSSEPTFEDVMEEYSVPAIGQADVLLIATAWCQTRGMTDEEEDAYYDEHVDLETMKAALGIMERPGGHDLLAAAEEAVCDE